MKKTIEGEVWYFSEPAPEKPTLIKRVVLWFRQILCRHDWECVAGYVLGLPERPLFRCKKCGKMEGL